jgi:hypothetical protein
VETFGSPDCYELGMHYVLGNDMLVYWQYVETDQFCKLDELDFAVFLSLYPYYLEALNDYRGPIIGEILVCGEDGAVRVYGEIQEVELEGDEENGDVIGEVDEPLEIEREFTVYWDEE